MPKEIKINQNQKEKKFIQTSENTFKRNSKYSNLHATLNKTNTNELKEIFTKAIQ